MAACVAHEHDRGASVTIVLRKAHRLRGRRLEPKTGPVPPASGLGLLGLLRWTRTSFSYYNKRVEVHASARKHGVADQDILHAIDHGLAFEDAGEDPERWLLIAPDTAGNLLEVVITAEGTRLVIHAMPMRDQYRRLLGL